MKNLSMSKHQKVQRLLFTSFMILGARFAAIAQTEFGIAVFTGAACQSELLNLYDNSDLKFSYGGGINGKYNFTEGIALQTGLQYLQKGSSRKFEDEKGNINFHYLEVPLQIAVSASEKAGFKNGQRMFFAAGPYFSYLLDTQSGNTVQANLEEEVNTLDVGLRFSSGILFPVFEDKKIEFSINYNMGLSEVYKSENNIQNKTGFISLGYQF